MKRISAVNALFWGLLLIFIDIKIGNFDIFNDILGLFIIILGLYNLKALNKSFKKAFCLAQVTLVWQIFCLSLGFSAFSRQIEVVFSLMVIDFIINMLMTYNIFAGLSRLAEEQGFIDLSKRLISAFRIYALAMIITVVSIFLMPIAFICLIISMILYIYLLVQIRSAYNSLSVTRSEKPEIPAASKAKTIISVILIGIIPIALATGIIGISERHVVETQPFKMNDLSENQDLILSIRSKMVDLGFEQRVVDSMPDSEIILYNNIMSVQSCHSQEFTCDGGKLMFSQYVSQLDTQNYRYTVYYVWTQKPKLAHAEALGIILNDRKVMHLNQTEYSSLNLCDIKDENGNIQIYASKDIADNQNILHTVKKFKLVNRKAADNYRGYLAFNFQVSADGPWAYNNSFYYIHQRTIFNDRGMDIIDFNKDNEWFSNETEDCFFKEYNVMALVDIRE